MLFELNEVYSEKLLAKGRVVVSIFHIR